MLDQLAAADFSPLIGTALQVTANAGAGAIQVPLTLVAVDEHPAPSPEFRAPFVLSLDGPANPVLAQGTYAIEHPAHGSLELFLVPHGAGPDRAQYSITLG